MTDRLAATSLRILGPRGEALAGDSGNPDSLENVNTHKLPNGALAIVNSAVIGTPGAPRQIVFILDKEATSGAVAPIAGPGFWQPLLGTGLFQYTTLVTVPGSTISVAANSGQTFTTTPPGITAKDFVIGVDAPASADSFPSDIVVQARIIKTGAPLLGLELDFYNVSTIGPLPIPASTYTVTIGRML